MKATVGVLSLGLLFLFFGFAYHTSIALYAAGVIAQISGVLETLLLASAGG